MFDDSLFNSLHIETVNYQSCRLQGICDMTTSFSVTATLHYVLSGEGEITFMNYPKSPLHKGSLVLIPALTPHTLYNFATSNPSDQTNPAVLPESLPAVIRTAPNGYHHQEMIVFCVMLTLSAANSKNLINLMREPVVAMASHMGLEQTLTSLIAELNDPAPGSARLQEALLMGCMIPLLRTQNHLKDKQLSDISISDDPKLRPAIQAMIDNLETNHSVDSLAQAATMSRSSFARRFHEAFGMGPMGLLRNLRIKKATNLLSTTDMPVKQIAQKTGFNSRTAFTRAFEHSTGSTPAKFRRSAQTQKTQ